MALDVSAAGCDAEQANATFKCTGRTPSAPFPSLEHRIAAAAAASHGQARRSAKPEVILERESIIIDTRKVAIGERLEARRRALGSESRADHGLDSSYTWDALGIDVLTRRGSDIVMVASVSARLLI